MSLNAYRHDTRTRLAGLQNTGVDVLIIGAGINGAGLFRDLCAQGVSCVIVDKNDFGSGTSAASSRLIHGGLKYLETGEFGLVAQSTLERNLLLKNAPHCVKPLLTVIPIFSWVSGVGAAIGTFFGAKSLARSRGALLIKAGLALYDFYGARERMMPRHKMLSRSKALQLFPALPDTIKAAATYYDAQVSQPERLVWELLRDGLDDNQQAAAINYCDVVQSEGAEVLLRSIDGAEIAVRPRIVVNAAGPWIDTVNARLGVVTRLIGGTKGSHILLEHPELRAMLAGQMMYFEADDGRICLAYEYEGCVLVGSTDKKAGNPDGVTCEDWETAYFLERLRAIFPKMTFSERQITYAYSGIRPLPASDAANPGLISRDHSAPVTEGDAVRPYPIISMVGGKWTTFRGFAEEVADGVLKRLERQRLLSTRQLAIGGGKEFPASPQAVTNWVDATAQETGLAQDQMAALFARYGTTARLVAQHVMLGNGRDCLASSSSHMIGEFDWIVANESAQTIADLVLRRTTVALSHRLLHPDIARLADVLTLRLGWNALQRSAEIEAFKREMLAKHGVAVG